MATGYMIRKGDKTSCGGQVLDGNPRFEIMGQPRASEGDPVSCGVTGQVYQILGGVHTFTNDGRRVAGSLDSSSTCPCKAALVPSCFIFSYESSSTKAAEAQKQHAMGTAPQRANVAAERAPSVPERQTTASSSLASQWEHWSPELIAVAGSQHDQGSGNKMMFIGQAVRELAEFLRSKPALTRTLVVFTPSYSEQMLSAARDSAEGYGANIIEITTAQELIDYLNNGKNRQQSPIERLSLFSHGVPQQIAFGYELLERSRMAFGRTELHPHLPPFLLPYRTTGQLCLPYRNGKSS